MIMYDNLDGFMLSNKWKLFCACEDAKTINETWHLFMINQGPLSNLYNGSFLNLLKGMYKKFTANVVLMVKYWKLFICNWEREKLYYFYLAIL